MGWSDCIKFAYTRYDIQAIQWDMYKGIAVSSGAPTTVQSMRAYDWDANFFMRSSVLATPPLAPLKASKPATTRV